MKKIKKAKQLKKEYKALLERYLNTRSIESALIKQRKVYKQQIQDLKRQLEISEVAKFLNPENQEIKENKDGFIDYEGAVYVNEEKVREKEREIEKLKETIEKRVKQIKDIMMFLEDVI